MLTSDDVTVSRAVRTSSLDDVRPLAGPLLCPQGIYTDKNSNMQMVRVCSQCHESLANKVIPELALVRGQWLGDTPDELRDLNFVEKLTVALCRHNNCVFQVKMGQRKLSGNAVVYSQPVNKFYDVLPPPREDLDECLVIVFIGKRFPTLQDYRRTPLLIRKDKVLAALNWLKLNHPGYEKVRIEPRNLDSYPSDKPVVDIRFIPQDARENPDNIAVFDPETEHGTEEGMCSFSVQGLSGAELANMTKTQRLLHALQHINNEGHFISYGRGSEPESMYHNPDLYPGLFPWLFPLGLGGFENKNLPPRLKTGRLRHIKRLLSYHDKRFQTDEYFLPIVFSQEQIRASVSGGHLVTNRGNFQSIANNLLKVDLNALSDLIQRGKEDGPLKPLNAREQECYNLLTPIRSVDGHVHGSLASKHYQRNELHSLIMQRGLPYFFITFSPVDYKSPICLYYCGSEDFDLDDPLLTIPSPMDRERLIASNPVGCSRFFHLMVTMFIEVLLAPLHPEGGLFGPTDSYYGTVESQGRLTLHLHLLLWIKGSLSPNEMKDRLVADLDGYRQKMFDWLDHTLQAQYSTGTLESVRAEVDRLKTSQPETDYEKYLVAMIENPCCLLPRKPPDDLSGDQLDEWLRETDFIADLVALFSNQHKHGMGCNWVEGEVCRARFPRDIRTEHEVEPDTGILQLKQLEKNINHFSPTMAALMMCNHDITLLRSGSQLKPIVAYVTDYITKTPLKTHAIFESIKSILSIKDEIIQGTTGMREVSRKLLTRIVNAITSRQEIGTPMITHYLQGYPDHYTNEKFKVVFWRSYVNFVVSSCNPELTGDAQKDESVLLDIGTDGVSGSSTRLDDYTLRPLELDDWCLYDFLKYTYVRSMTDRERERMAKYLVNYDSMQTASRPPMMFDLNHCRVSTHVIQIQDSSSREYILTFIGGNLPKCAEGTQVTEDYAKVMLIFFKPGGWRTGKDLKSEGQSWKTAFEDSTFSERAVTAMRSFNTFWECRDARFDFSAERQKNKKKTSTGFVSIDKYIDDHRSLETEEHEAFSAAQPSVLKDSLAVLEKSDRLGKVTKHILTEMKEMDAFLRHSLNAHSADDDMQVEDNDDLELPHRTARQWRAELQLQKDKIRAMKLAFLPTESTPDVDVKRPRLSKHDGDVVLIDPASVNDLCEQYSREKFSHLSASEISKRIMSDFTLNDGQKRSFGIVADHLGIRNPPSPLKMYLGGVGGTGKSQVIKSIIAYLAARGEMHRFIVMAPTGSAAALIDGSTYHSTLGFGNRKTVNYDASATKVKEELSCVDLIFLDEISMVSCEDFYQISVKLGRAFPHTGHNMGGKSMIVAGDFGQLPPGSPRSHTLYSGSLDVKNIRGKKQNATMGKSFWHTFTTVVLLTENMRLRSMTDEDVAFSVALGNLRYKRCTPKDIALLRTRVVGIGVDVKEAQSAPFRYVSILTGLNSHRDAINDATSIQFATENKLPLLTFHSKDTWTSSPSNEYLERTGMTCAEANQGFQRYLWTLPPSVTKNMPGKLTICKNMPVMLKYNEATELCATNGAEANVLGWNEKVGPLGRRSAENIFVTLRNPPRNIQLPGLPVNVVPIPAAPSSLKIKLEDDNEINIGRTQVRLIPNFAMTDYMSQGRTRPMNIVDLSRSKGHQSMYTCLSRSTSLKGTLIIRDFNDNKMKGGLSGDLRREFAELECLDEYTRLRTEGRLPADCPTSTREAVLVYFRNWQSSQALSNPFVEHADMSDFAPFTGPPEPVTTHPMLAFTLRWNNMDWSCAYDTAIHMLWSVFLYSANDYSVFPAVSSSFVDELKTIYSMTMRGDFADILLLKFRHKWRASLHALYPDRFPNEGRLTASLSYLLDITVSSKDPYAVLSKVCQSCGFHKTVNSYRSHIWPIHPSHAALQDTPSRTLDTAIAINSIFEPGSTRTCNVCQSSDSSSMIPHFTAMPAFLILEIFAETITDRVVNIEKSVRTSIKGNTYRYDLAAVAYHGNEHFVSKTLAPSGRVWCYDGMLNDGQPWLSVSDDLNDFHAKSPHLLWYILVADS